MQVWQHKRLTTALLALAVTVGIDGGSISDAADQSAPTDPGYAWPKGVAPELQRIQQELGGSAVDRFEALKESAGPAWATDHARAADKRRPSDPAAASTAPWIGRPQIETLREAAGQIDVLANRLERLELYAQADGLREQAQRFRVEARRMAAFHGRPSMTPTPATMIPTPQPSWNPAAPPASTPAPSLTPGIIAPPLEESRPTPAAAPLTTAVEPPQATAPASSQPTPTITPTPSNPLEPTPLPENQLQPPSLEPAPLRE